MFNLIRQQSATFESVCLLCNINRDANRVNPDQAAPIGAARSRSTLLAKRLQNVSVDNKNIRHFVICALRVNTCEVSDIQSGLSRNALTFARPKGR